MRTNGADITTLGDFVGANRQVKLPYMEHIGVINRYKLDGYMMLCVIDGIVIE